jgi:hypothetical protein
LRPFVVRFVPPQALHLPWPYRRFGFEDTLPKSKQYLIRMAQVLVKNYQYFGTNNHKQWSSH